MGPARRPAGPHAAAFQITQDNARSQNSDNTYTANGTIRVRGARSALAGQLDRDGRSSAATRYLDAKIIDGIAVGTQGKVPANTAVDSATLWTTYDVGRTGRSAAARSTCRERFANNTDLCQVPGYTRWDATFAYRQPRYDVRLNVFNIFDEHYYDSLIQSDGGRAVPGSGRTAMLSFPYRM